MSRVEVDKAGGKSHLSLDLVDGHSGVLDVGGVGRGHVAGVAADGRHVGADADHRKAGEDSGVCEPRRSPQPQPAVDHDKNRSVVQIPDRKENQNDRERDVPRLPHLPSDGPRGAPPALHSPTQQATEPAARDPQDGPMFEF